MISYSSYVAIFRQSYMEKFGNEDKLLLYTKDDIRLQYLEDLLMTAIQNIIGFRIGRKHEMARVKYLFNDICENIDPSSDKYISEQIIEYQQNFRNLIDTHPMVDLLLTVLRRIYSPEYDGKPGNYNKTSEESEDKQFMLYRPNFLGFGLITRRDDANLPYISIGDVDALEDALNSYISTVESSNTFYNRSNIETFRESYDEKTLRMMLLEGTILNISSKDTYDLVSFFKRYESFVKNNELKEFEYLSSSQRIMGTGYNIGIEKTNDESEEKFNVLCMLKRSDVEYETPYYFSYFIYNNNVVLEMPNIRLGIEEKDGAKKAYILASQSSQGNLGSPYYDENKFKLLSDKVKNNIPKTSKFRYFNPNHLISILFTFGILKSLGVDHIEIVTHMPLRCYKTISDKKYNPEEANKYLKRVTEKNVYTYQKLAAVSTGIDIENTEFENENMIITLEDVIECQNEYLTNIFTMGYEYGLKIKPEDLDLV